MILGKYIQPGEAIDYLNTGDNLKAGQVVKLAERCGIAMADIAQNAVGAVAVVGVFELPKDTNKTFEVGATAYYKDDVGITSDKSGNTAIGFVVEKVSATDTTAKIKIG